MYREAAIVPHSPATGFVVPFNDFHGPSTCPSCSSNDDVTWGKFCTPVKRIRQYWWWPWSQKCAMTGHHLHQTCHRCKCKWAVHPRYKMDETKVFRENLK